MIATLARAGAVVLFLTMLAPPALAVELVAGCGFGFVYTVEQGQSLDFEKLKKLHSRTVYAVEARDGLMLSGDKKGRIGAWDLASGEGKILKDAHRSAVRSIAFSPDGGRIASASKDRTIYIWDAASLKRTRKLEGHDSYVYDAAWSPDGGMLASAGSDNLLVLWDADSWEKLAETKAHYNAIYASRFSPDGTMVATCSADKFVKLWKVPELTLVREFLAHDNGTYGLAWSPDGGMLVTAGADKTVRFWDPATGQELRSVDFPESVAVNTVVFDPDGGHVYIGDDSGEVLMIDVAAGAIVERGKAQASVKSLALID